MDFLFSDDDSNKTFAYNLSMGNNAKLMLPQPSEYLRTFGRAVEILNVFGIPFIILIGCVGNSLSLIVFCTTNLRWHSSSVYLAFLNAVDTIFLMCLVVTWLGFLDINVVHKNGCCQATLYLSFISGFLSVYAVVSFTIERWVVVFYPLKRTVWCTRKRATFVICGLTLLSVVIYSYAGWGYGLTELGNTGVYICHYKSHFYTAVQVMTVVDSVITLILPSTVIITLNVCITFKIWSFMHKRRMSFRTTIPENENSVRLSRGNVQNLNTRVPISPGISGPSFSFDQTNLINQQNRFRSSNTRQRMKLKTTRSLIVVSTVFVVLNMPSHAFKLSVIVKELAGFKEFYSMEALMWQHVCQIIYYTNFAVNYFLYCACSKSFRIASLKLFRNITIGIRNRWNM